MGWGSLFTDPNILGTVGKLAVGNNAKLGAGVSFLTNLMNYGQNKKEEDANKSNYYSALARQKALAEQQAQLAQQRAAYESAARNTLTSQNAELDGYLRSTQASMGAMPQFDQGQVDQDYAAIKSGQMNDFNQMLSVLESQGRAAQVERLGGADSRVADDMRTQALATKMAPILQKLDQESYDQAIARSSSKMNLYNTSRSNTLNEIKNTLQPGMTNTMAILNGTNATDSNIGNQNTNTQMQEYGTNYTNMNKTSGQNAQTLQESLADLLSKTYNKNTNTDYSRTPGFVP